LVETIAVDILSQNFCADVDNLVETITLHHVLDNWDRFLVSSTISLQAVFRYNGNQFSFSTVVQFSFSTVHSVHLKEAYENAKTVGENLTLNVTVGVFMGTLMTV
jgi:hypothetical protein